MHAAPLGVLRGAPPESERSRIFAESLPRPRQIVGDRDRSHVVGGSESLYLIERRREIVGGLTIGMLRHRFHSGGMEILHCLLGEPARVRSQIVKGQLVDMRISRRSVKPLERLG